MVYRLRGHIWRIRPGPEVGPVAHSATGPQLLSRQIKQGRSWTTQRPKHDREKDPGAKDGEKTPHRQFSSMGAGRAQTDIPAAAHHPGIPLRRGEPESFVEGGDFVDGSSPARCPQITSGSRPQGTSATSLVPMQTPRRRAPRMAKRLLPTTQGQFPEPATSFEAQLPLKKHSNPP